MPEGVLRQIKDTPLFTPEFRFNINSKQPTFAYQKSNKYENFKFPFTPGAIFWLQESLDY